MTDTGFGIPDYDDAAVARIRAYVEQVTGGRVVRFERQARGRHHRDAACARRARVAHLRLSRRPPCIVMQSIEGTRDFSDLDAETLISIGRDYMAAVAAIHAVPLEPFMAKDVERPEGAEDSALVGLRAYQPHYLRTRRKREPMIDFVIGWIHRNVPKHRTEAPFIQFDSGQYLVKDGRMTQLYDFEFGMIGDPMVDLATMGMRNSYEPLGAPLPELIRHEAATGKPVDHEAVLFHVLLFSTLGTMQFVGAVAEPRPGDPHSVYLQFDILLRRSILLALSTLAGVVALPDLSPLPDRPGDNSALIAKLADTVAGIVAADPGAEAQKAQAIELIEWMSRADALGAPIIAQDVADVSALLGRPFDDWTSAEAALDDFVQQAGPDRDADLITLFGRIEGRRLQAFGSTSIGMAALNVVLPQTR